MSGAFSKPKTPKIQKQEPIEDVNVIRDDATDEQQREKKRIAASSGYNSTLVAGIQAALKRRLGE